MSDGPAARYRFGAFEVDVNAGELRRKGMRIKLHAQPFQVLVLLLRRPGEVLTREEISRQLWAEGTFVDYEHGVNSAINRLREALGDKASQPRFVETLARRGYRFVAPVECVTANADVEVSTPVDPNPQLAETGTGFFDRVLASPEDLPRSPLHLVVTLFVLLQLMYIGFYVGALANLNEIDELLSPLPYAGQAYLLLVGSAAMLIPVRAFLLCAVLFRAPRLQEQYLKIWWLLLVVDILWALAPFLLLHHMTAGVALACMTLLVYSPFAQRSLIIMGAGSAEREL